MPPPVRRFGHTDLKVSRIALGTVALGLDYGTPGSSIRRPDFRAAEKLLNHALDCSVNLIDTARSYGESEEIIGRAIGHRRSAFILASKVVPASDLAVTKQSVEQSLQALRADVIDIVQIHCKPDHREPDRVTTDALLDLQREGKIRYLGASVYGQECAQAAIDAGCFQAIQVAYSVLDRRPEEQVLTTAKENGVGVLARSVLLKGILTSRYRDLPSFLTPLRHCVENLIDASGFSAERLPELAYRYVLSDARLDCALSGAVDIHELEKTLEWAAAGPLPGDVVDQIRKLEIPPEDLLNPANWN